MLFYISYRGTRLGQPMTLQEAETKMIRLKHWFVGIEVVPASELEAEEENAPKKRGRPARKPLDLQG